jgi:hypothetical protein
VFGLVKAKAPGTDMLPPLKLEIASESPSVIAEAAGNVRVVGVALPTVTETCDVTFV